MMPTMRAVILAVAAAGCLPLADGNLGIDIHVASISPAQVPSTGGARVTIVGTNLDGGVAVAFGGVPLGLADVDGDGRADAIMNNGIILSAGSSGWGDFLAFFPVLGVELQVAAIADFDGDGVADVAVMTPDGAQVVRVVDRALVF